MTTPRARWLAMVSLAAVTLSLTGQAFGDGGFFYETEAANIAQTRQEAIIVINEDLDAEEPISEVTYVLRTRYAGAPETFAWVIPAPATPTDVVAYEDSAFFEQLDEYTKPRFQIWDWGASHGLSCACTPGGVNLGPGTLVTVEAEGEAGIFNWAALTSTGSDALLTWLNANGFAIPEQAGEILDAYIEEGWHFLALRVREPEDIVAGEQGEFEIPPIQFTCQTSERVYPMRISRVSAAEETEVVLYLFASYEVKSANLSNRIVNEGQVAYDSTSPSLTTYESKFREIVEAYPEGALVKEYQGDSPPAPAVLLEAQPSIDGLFLTRLRTVLHPEQMSQDIEFEEGSVGFVPPTFYVEVYAQEASLWGLPLGALVVFVCGGWAMKRVARRLDKR